MTIRRPTHHDNEIFIWAHLEFGPEKWVSHQELSDRYDAWLNSKQILEGKAHPRSDLSPLHNQIVDRGGGEVRKGVKAQSEYRGIYPKSHFIGVTVIHMAGQIEDKEMQKLQADTA